MTISTDKNTGLSAEERAEGMETRTDQRNLLWRYVYSIVLIAATVSVAIVAARWTGKLG
jgi:hypothetical protein